MKTNLLAEPLMQPGSLAAGGCLMYYNLMS